jgi:hypothetical protein
VSEGEYRLELRENVERMLRPEKIQKDVDKTERRNVPIDSKKYFI